jgi:hypothetical protein
MTPAACLLNAQHATLENCPLALAILDNTIGAANAN